MSNVAFLTLPTEAEALMNRRASATESCFRLIRSGADSLDMFPRRLLEAFEVEAWKEHPTPNKAVVRCADFAEWISAPFPKGIESDPETVELILTNAKDQVLAAKARTLFEQMRMRGPGNPRIAEQGRNEDGTVQVKDRNVDNVHGSNGERPTGNSAAAGIRRLIKAAAEGNEEAATQLALTQERGENGRPRQSIHGACREAGLFKGTKLDPDVKARCARSVAEWIVERLGQDDPSGIVADLSFVSGSAVAKEIKNLVGESAVFDRGGIA